MFTFLSSKQCSVSTVVTQLPTQDKGSRVAYVNICQRKDVKEGGKLLQIGHGKILSIADELFHSVKHVTELTGSSGETDRQTGR